MIKEYNWHVDGHRVALNITKSEVQATASICPFGESAEAECFHLGISGCVVNYFINNYGLETNCGSAPAAPSFEIGWAILGSEWDIDLVEFAMIPTHDPWFESWYTSLTSE